MLDVAYDAFLGALSLRQVLKSSLQPNVQHHARRAAGSLSAAEISVLHAGPMVALTSGDVNGVVQNTTPTGGLLLISSTWTIPYIKRATGGTYEGTLAHTTLSGANALILPKSVSARQDDEQGATVELELYAASTDGETDPVAPNVNQTLGAAAFSASHEFGPISVNGTEIESAISLNVGYGLSVRSRRFGGDHYPQLTGMHIDAASILPTMTIGFADIDGLNTYGPLFKAMTAAKANLRKRVDGGTTVPDASLAHIQYGFADGLILIDNAGGEDGEDSEVSITLLGKSLTVSQNVAVSL